MFLSSCLYLLVIRLTQIRGLLYHSSCSYDIVTLAVITHTYGICLKTRNNTIVGNEIIVFGCLCVVTVAAHVNAYKTWISATSNCYIVFYSDSISSYAQIQHTTKTDPFTCCGVEYGSFDNYNYSVVCYKIR